MEEMFYGGAVEGDFLGVGGGKWGDLQEGLVLIICLFRRGGEEGFGGWKRRWLENKFFIQIVGGFI